MILSSRPPDGTSWNFREIPVADGRLRLYPRLFSIEESEDFLDSLKEEVDWKSERITMFGRSIALPRLTAWFGDPGRSYAYSGISRQPDAWIPTLLRIKARIESVTASRFNSVLLNFYRNGSDSVSWHSDDEPELGENPVIGSVSFGSERPFLLRHRSARDCKGGHAPSPLTLFLPNGSYLEMGPGMQRNWVHKLPKRPRLTGERINLTFRRVLVHPAASMPQDH